MTVLWRAAATADPWLGYGSFWAADRDHATWYQQHQPPRGGPVLYGWSGGPALYRAEVEVDDDEVANLGADPWAALDEWFGIEHEDHQCEPLHEVVWVLARGLRVRPRPRWIVFNEGGGDQWVYLGEEPIAAELESERGAR